MKAALWTRWQQTRVAKVEVDHLCTRLRLRTASPSFSSSSLFTVTIDPYHLVKRSRSEENRDRMKLTIIAPDMVYEHEVDSSMQVQDIVALVEAEVSGLSCTGPRVLGSEGHQAQAKS